MKSDGVKESVSPIVVFFSLSLHLSPLSLSLLGEQTWGTGGG